MSAESVHELSYSVIERIEAVEALCFADRARLQAVDGGSGRKMETYSNIGTWQEATKHLQVQLRNSTYESERMRTRETDEAERRGETVGMQNQIWWQAPTEPKQEDTKQGIQRQGKQEWRKRKKKQQEGTLQQRQTTHRIDSAARHLETAGLDSTAGRSGASRLVVDASAVGQTLLSGHSC
ncbi:hypothetical protein CSOJ01_14746 [Colletotrichum sojae]|uniref:Uncharacterized protein n=1 Tax=Colletotrichum sojae TaxID=2175907 RepID=A0A8H6IPN3_9PEZI|nr:hypothetical protein CSOJ01_14746 [Colletotrichum sojae]